jgi:hypothetical protein
VESPNLVLDGAARLKVRDFDITPDGKRFLTLVTAGQNQPGTTVPQILVVVNWFEELKQRVAVR